ncbi:hypothetical protein X777_14681 [Ooceraea biroi]|uniref:Uncharacterized protein n=1 Tax=Ooceraea biroi TaxID=2015173 RepID=A0A026WTU0_OOCBI|nr:hypothetical protein X777_14681 [Ooceraea biroi]
MRSSRCERIRATTRNIPSCLGLERDSWNTGRRGTPCKKGARVLLRSCFSYVILRKKKDEKRARMNSCGRSAIFVPSDALS